MVKKDWLVLLIFALICIAAIVLIVSLPDGGAIQDRASPAAVSVAAVS